MTNRKKNIITGVFLALMLMAGYFFYNYGWRSTGFRMVTEPSYLKLNYVGEKDGKIQIEGYTALSIGSYQGAVLEYKEGILYVGIRYSLFGHKPDFKVVYDQLEGPVQRVVFKKHKSEKTIWLRPWKEQIMQ